MAAPLSSFSGENIYIDTMIFYLLLRGNSHAQVRFFFERMEHGDFSGYTSVLTFDELAYRLILAFVRDKYTGSPLDLLRSREAELLHEFSPRVQTLLEQLLQFPHLHLIDLRGEDIT